MYWSNSESVATNYLQKILETFLLLSENPEIGRKRIEIRFDLRSFPCQTHVIFYTFQQNRLVILRVLHGSMDHSERF
ncbi:MAG: type II toxin-antitoxin system RelE/ParE family toxin [Sumerlaeia bacterium]